MRLLAFAPFDISFWRRESRFYGPIRMRNPPLVAALFVYECAHTRDPFAIRHLFYDTHYAFYRLPPRMTNSELREQQCTDIAHYYAGIPLIDAQIILIKLRTDIQIATFHTGASADKVTIVNVHN